MLHDEKIQPYKKSTDEWRVVIETPKGSRYKYKYDVKLGVFTLHQMLPEGLAFPADFGFLPSTVGADGDPLDVLLLMDGASFSGCLVPSVLIGVIEAEQTEKNGKAERNDRLIAVPCITKRYADIKSAKDLDKRDMHEMETFFATYNKELGKKLKVIGFGGPNRAIALAKAGMRKFSARRRKS